jgi:hypothetical protein
LVLTGDVTFPECAPVGCSTTKAGCDGRRKTAGGRSMPLFFSGDVRLGRDNVPVNNVDVIGPLPDANDRRRRGQRR